ncbi:hypothetical protein ACROYT_G011679 [Oculina patagonica]
MIIQGEVAQDPSKWAKLSQFKTNAMQTVGTILAKFFAFFVAAATWIIKMESEIPMEKIRETNELKEKEEEIRVTKLKEIEHHTWNLEEKIKRASRGENSFRISHIENIEWEMSLITAKELVVTCGLHIAYLQELAGKLESGAREVIMIKEMIIKRIIIGGLAFALCAMLYYGAYVKEASETGTTVKEITVASLMAVGMAMFCKREAQVLFNNSKLVGECEQVKYELGKSKLAYMKYKQSVEDTLPEQKKLLHVMDHEVSLYSSLQPLKCKDD